MGGGGVPILPVGTTWIWSGSGSVTWDWDWREQVRLAPGSQQTRAIRPMLFQCWSSVEDGGPTLDSIGWMSRVGWDLPGPSCTGWPSAYQTPCNASCVPPGISLPVNIPAPCVGPTSVQCWRVWIHGRYRKPMLSESYTCKHPETRRRVNIGPILAGTDMRKMRETNVVWTLCATLTQLSGNIGYFLSVVIPEYSCRGAGNSVA